MTLKNVMKQCWGHSKYAAVLTLCSVMAVSAVVPVQAASTGNTEIIHNEQQLDLFTGEPVSPETEEEEDTLSIRLNDYCTYNKTDQNYVYQFGDTIEKTVYASVADGMYTNKSVTLTWAEPMICDVYRNGNEVECKSGVPLTDPGFYQTLISDATGSDEYSIAFCIIDRYTNMTSYRIPEGFEITEATYEGSAMSAEGNLINLGKEGTYHVVLKTIEGDLTSTVDMTVDHTAPTLLLAEVNEDGYAQCAVDVSDAEPGAKMYATIDGTEYKVGRKLAQPGNYHLSIQDEAGNVTEYNFTIRMYFTISTVVVMLLIAGVVAALIIYLVISRKRIVVR